ncbi:MAG: sulfide/dihydroorotate dehydrogenase-like FAD/NAD-binding protein [Dehalococcoidia bacterium]|jgi:ferredoxin--NADP+ reductase|nr:sulfide/dihydroorotate dehydrogenase-like FAD/NAD-binding protein [Dehalococcoidia bacterium]MDP7239967.1 sulfide/dihydroorotate dehydrogenase-like FAD/NAD-binding protein [Dehalococcoidia bacterium]MDP7469877.1 sulfide/dihydroorotate dehydrogenase-like FAD/NAD-binding protein [Dehalococcoidia bacterium]
MFRIQRFEQIASTNYLMEIEAPAIARTAQAGQFVVIIPTERGERIPLTLADWNGEHGTITIVFQAVGTSTTKLSLLRAGDELPHVVGPLGHPSGTDNYGTVIPVGGGVGIAAIAPIARALKHASNRVITIMGARTGEFLFWEDRLAAFSDQLIVTTDDGSYGRHGVVTQPLLELLQDGAGVKRVIAVGPTVMMKFVAQATRPFGVKTIVSLNPIMIDGTGMCGGCRVCVDGETRFTCADGPEFDGHLVDWDLLAARQRAYTTQEKHSRECLQQRLNQVFKE